ncbi:hypothetical protein GCM10010503_31870 [Streptomyces lucensis JCM 4490]|uniref:Uncharacterized protein n=1 Tax=Streptomyces lucensis JCM 4490 TaxID=1306176 RepID=A0A918MSL7_9ACTN|nr:hypothetical protein [Streptomyces lucensis]GGW52453.1 hypothetical protein GCM10010503_31870 [Streptomyces lucensis JCM 4490]
MTDNGPGPSVGMRLNQIPSDPGGSAGPSGGAGAGGGRKDLASSPAEKQAAAKALQDHIEPDTRKAGDWADDDTGAAVKALQAKDGDGWLTSGALKAAHKTWGEQVQNLMNRLSSEKAALRSTNTVFQGTDLGVGSRVRTSSSLDQY